MKKNFLFLFVAVALLFGVPKTAKSYTNSLSTDVITLLNNRVFNIRYETVLSKTNSAVFDLALDTKWENVVGFQVAGMYRWYLRDVFPVKTSGLEGFNLGAQLVLGGYVWDYPVSYNHSEKQTDFFFQIGGEAAYKWVFDGFQVEPRINLGIPLVKESYYSNFYWTVGVNLGYAW